MKKFVVEFNNDISNQDIKNLRNLYTPIIGIESVALYTAFVDQQSFSKKVASYLPFKEIEKLLKIDALAIEKARMNLEAVGLIRTYEKADNVNFIIAVNSPLKIEQFKQNKLLFNKYMAVVGIEQFERFEYLENNKKYSKDEFKEVSAKFQDLFELGKTSDKKSINNTLEFSNISVQTIEEAIVGLPSAQFVNFLTDKKVSNSLYSNISHLQNVGLQENAINEIVNYSFKVNGKIVANHVFVIGNDLVAKGITSHKEIKAELIEAFGSKTSLDADKQETVVNNGESLEWDELFDSLGGDL